MSIWSWSRTPRCGIWRTWRDEQIGCCEIFKKTGIRYLGRRRDWMKFNSPQNQVSRSLIEWCNLEAHKVTNEISLAVASLLRWKTWSLSCGVRVHSAARNSLKWQNPGSSVSTRFHFKPFAFHHWQSGNVSDLRREKLAKMHCHSRYLTPESLFYLDLRYSTRYLLQNHRLTCYK